MEFTHITLQTSQLKRLKEFYTEKLKLELLSDLLHEFSVKIGSTKLTFIGTDTTNSNPFYHFAINIPHNLLSEAKAWLTSLVALHSEEGEDEVYFESWNAHAIYFTDPAGNIVELIARHNLQNSSTDTFNQRQLLYISEVGIVTDDVPSLVKQMNDLGIDNWKETKEGLTPLGSETGLFIIVKKKRQWFFSDKLAEFYPIQAVVKTAGTFCFNTINTISKI